MVSVSIRDVLARARKQNQKTDVAKYDVSKALALLKQRAEAGSRTSLQALVPDKLQVCRSQHFSQATPVGQSTISSTDIPGSAAAAMSRVWHMLQTSLALRRRRPF